MAKGGFVTGHDEQIGKGDLAGLPRDVKMEKYPPCRNYKGGMIDDTITGVDDVNSLSEAKASKYRSNQK
jgi:hypothetical protein